MLFVSIVPTAAFAAGPEYAVDDKKNPTIENSIETTVTDNGDGTKTVEATKDYQILKNNNYYPIIDNPLMNVSVYKKEISDMVKNTKDNIKDAYGTLIGSQMVYTSAKTMDDTIVNLVDALTKKLVDEKKTLPTTTGDTYTFTKSSVNTIKDQVRYLIDDMVAADMAKSWKYTDADGKVDPLKYAQTFNKAVTDALTNKKFMKGYEAVATWAALWALCSDVNDKLDDEYDAFYETIDTKFDKNFKFYYPDLWKTYIDTYDDKAEIAKLFTQDGLTLTEALASAEAVIDDPWANEFYAYVDASSHS
jgi:hypothetical protein